MNRSGSILIQTLKAYFDMAKYFNVTVKWNDDKTVEEDLVFKLGDVGVDDESVFYYIQSESELKDMMKYNENDDFVILNYTQQ